MEKDAPYIVLKELAGNAPPELNAIQEILAPHVFFLTNVWISVCIMTAIVVCVHVWNEYRSQGKQSRIEK